MVILMFLCFLLPGRGIWCLTGPSKVTIRSGNSMTMQCVYDRGYEDYIKYWCKGESSTSCIIQIKTATHKKEVSAGRLTIMDTPATHSFNVTTVNVRVEDSDIYYCGIERNLKDNMHMIKVEVQPGICPITTPWTDIVDFSPNITEIEADEVVEVSCQKRYQQKNITLQCREESGEFVLSPQGDGDYCVDDKTSALPNQARSLLTSTFGLVVPFLLKLAALLVSLVLKIFWIILRRLRIYREELEQRRSLQGQNINIQLKTCRTQEKDDVSGQRKEVQEIYENMTDKIYTIPPKK